MPARLERPRALDADCLTLNAANFDERSVLLHVGDLCVDLTLQVASEFGKNVSDGV